MWYSSYVADADRCQQIMDDGSRCPRPKGNTRSGLCPMHRVRKLHGTPMGQPVKIHRSPLLPVTREFILSYCEEAEGPLDTPCLLWTRMKNAKGYGRLRLHGRNHYAHRAMYAIAMGLDLARPETWPELVQHICHSSSCCNPAHLVSGSVKTNALDMLRRHRRPYRKLTPAMVRGIRFWLQQGKRYPEVAALAREAMGADITRKHVGNIARGEVWASVPAAKEWTGDLKEEDYA